MATDPDSQQTFTVGRLARRAGLSRSTLLYYDSIGLLRPSGGRSGDGAYRCYSAADARRLEQICSYRRAGLPLKEIARLLDASAQGGALRETLGTRLEAINAEIGRLKDQREVIVGLLQTAAIDRVERMSKRAWVELLTQAGYSSDDMRRWHLDFERDAPEQHQRFLRALGIPAPEVRRMRRAAQRALAEEEHGSH